MTSPGARELFKIRPDSQRVDSFQERQFLPTVKFRLGWKLNSRTSALFSKPTSQAFPFSFHFQFNHCLLMLWRKTKVEGGGGTYLSFDWRRTGHRGTLSVWARHSARTTVRRRGRNTRFVKIDVNTRNRVLEEEGEDTKSLLKLMSKRRIGCWLTFWTCSQKV